MLWAAMFLTVMLGFVALGIDVAKLATTKTQLQNAADAAALAGASAIDPLTGTLLPDSAIARAQSLAAQNRAFVNGPEPVQLLAGDVSFPAANEIRVTVRRDAASGGAVVTHIARVLGVGGLEARATASARVEPAEQVFCGLVPLWASPPDGAATFETGCGQPYTLKEGGGDGSKGNYGGLTFPSCDGGPCASMPERGANTFRCLLESGYCCTIETGQVLVTEPGNMSGPVQKGIEARFARDTDSREGICYAEYRGNGERVVMVPVTTRPDNGRTDVVVTGFSAFFVRAIPGNGDESILEGEFLYDVVAGHSDPVGGNESNGTLFSIRLVR
jgi:Flp pilus assembly protein TadG